MSPTSPSSDSPSKLGVEESLARFANVATPPIERQAALTALISSKFLPKQATRAEVAGGRAILLEQAVKAADPGDRLLAIAESVRLTQVVKRWADDTIARLRESFVSELPPMRLLGDADDRLNLARACTQMQAEWLSDYLPRSIADEEAGEKARAELLGGLLARSADLAEAMKRLAGAFQVLRPDTEVPADTLARRVTRTLTAMRAAILDIELEAGDDLGGALHSLVTGWIAGVGRPQDEKVRIDLSREALLMLHDVLRTRFSVAADPDMYRVVEYCRRLCGGSVWPDEMRVPLERLTTDVTEALILLGRQGLMDQGLLDQLHTLCSYPERAQAVAKNIAAKHSELPEGVRAWLQRGRQVSIRPASEAAEQIAAANADGCVGLALQEVRQARQLAETLTAPLSATITIYEPTLSSATSELLNRIKSLALHVEQTASLRSVELYGVPGEEIEIATKFFEIAGPRPRQRMTVRQPAIVRRKSDGSIGEVITKGIVE